MSASNYSAPLWPGLPSSQAGSQLCVTYFTGSTASQVARWPCVHAAGTSASRAAWWLQRTRASMSSEFVAKPPSEQRVRKSPTPFTRLSASVCLQVSLHRHFPSLLNSTLFTLRQLPVEAGPASPTAWPKRGQSPAFQVQAAGPQCRTGHKHITAQQSTQGLKEASPISQTWLHAKLCLSRASLRAKMHPTVSVDVCPRACNASAMGRAVWRQRRAGEDTTAVRRGLMISFQTAQQPLFEASVQS